MSAGDLSAPDPDAQMVMAVLMASPNRDEPGMLLAAAKAYGAIRSAREAGRIPANHRRDAAQDSPEMA